MTPEEIRRMPKIELHCHLDGSLSREFVSERLGRDVAPEELTVSPGCTSLAEYLEKFDLPLSCMQDEEGLEGAAYALMRSMAAENVIYAEVRFAPTLSLKEGLDVRQVIEAALRGLERGRDEFGIDFGLICCAMLEDEQALSWEMFKVASEFLGKGVVAGDLAGDEAPYAIADFADLLKRANQELGLPLTIHAGEAAGVQNVVDAVNAGAVRVGHAVTMGGHPEVERLLAEKGIGVESAPSSNLQTTSVARAEDHPMREFFDAGLLVTINTDNRSVSGVSLSSEIALAQEAMGFTDDEIRQLVRNAALIAFVDDAERERLLARLA